MSKAYFAYGSNMDPVQMARRCPGARALGAALLPGHALTFTWDSGFWRGGVGHVVPADADEVWGVLWEIDDAHEASLDRYELVAKNVYTKATVTVRHRDRDVEALIYLATATYWRQPSRRYLRALIRGAEAHELPATYVTRLSRLLG